MYPFDPQSNSTLSNIDSDVEENNCTADMVTLCGKVSMKAVYSIDLMCNLLHGYSLQATFP